MECHDFDTCEAAKGAGPDTKIYTPCAVVPFDKLWICVESWPLYDAGSSLATPHPYQHLCDVLSVQLILCSFYSSGRLWPATVMNTVNAINKQSIVSAIQSSKWNRAASTRYKFRWRHSSSIQKGIWIVNIKIRRGNVSFWMQISCHPSLLLQHSHKCKIESRFTSPPHEDMRRTNSSTFFIFVSSGSLSQSE